MGVFAKCKNLESCILPETLETIGTYSFNGCSNLPSISFPSSLKTIGDAAFSDCTAFTSIDFPSSITAIGNNAFKGCTALTNVIFPTSLVTIGKSAFNNCTSLEIEDLSLPNLETLESSTFNGVKISKISNLGKITAVNPGNSSSANLGDKSVLREITLPNTIKTIGANTFSGYTALETIIIENGASGINVGANAFSGLPSSTTFNVDPDVFVSLGSNAFNGTSIWNEVTFTNVTRLDYQVFRGSTISKIKLPSVETMAGDNNYEGIFSFCPNLVLVDIGENCSSIGSNSLGRYVGTSGNNVTVIVRATTPPSLAGALINTGWVYATVGELYVPDASVNAYKEATN